MRTKMSGTIEVISGCMFSGKTEAPIHKVQESRMKINCVTF